MVKFHLVVLVAFIVGLSVANPVSRFYDSTKLEQRGFDWSPKIKENHGPVGWKTQNPGRISDNFNMIRNTPTTPNNRKMTQIVTTEPLKKGFLSKIRQIGTKIRDGIRSLKISWTGF